MLAKLGYYIFVIPLSYLPMWGLYLITDFIFLLFISIIPYRKKVIQGNIDRSFPEKTQKERNKIRRKFYRHFTDILAEGVKNLTISKRELSQRMKVTNPEIMQALHDKGKSVLLVSGHYNNWEWLITSQSFLFPHKAFGIGMPLTSKFWDKKINERRSRYGMSVVHAKNYKEELRKSEDEPNAVLVLSDQAPGDAKKSYWMEFLNQPTPILFGTEIMANDMDRAVVNFITKKTRRGYYEITLSLITDEPRSMQWGEITERHTRLLEQEIKQMPYFWLWSHKRWKREIPENLEKLKNEQRERFNAKFRS